MMNILNVFNNKKLKSDQKIVILKKTIVLLKANLSLPEIIAYLKKDYPIDLFYKVEEEVLRGERLSKAISNNCKLEPFIFGILSVGEQTGEFVKSLEIILNYLEKKKKLKNKILSSSFYPLILLGAIVILLIFINNYLFPILLDIYNSYGIKVNFAIKAFMNIEKVLTYLSLSIGVLLIFVYMIKKNGTSKLTYIIDRNLMKISIYRSIYFYYFFLNIYYFLNSGFTISESLESILKIEKNSYAIKRISCINNYIKNGNRFSKALEAENFIDNRIVGIISIGEKTGNIDTSIRNIVLLLREEIYYDIDKKSKLIEPMLIILMGIIITAIVVFILMPLSNIDFYLN